VRDAFAIDYASADLELPFFELYARVQTRLAEFLHVPSSSAAAPSLPYENDVIIQVGEGMLALWSALKSTIKAGDRVLAISNGAALPPPLREFDLSIWNGLDRSCSLLAIDAVD
jgi:aspartate aminotransferase-like enzyme